MKKTRGMGRFFIVLLALTLVVGVAVPTFAATDDSRGSGNFFSYMATFIKKLVVPSDNYFNSKLSVLNDNVNKKLGGVAQLYHIIENFFKSLNMPDSKASLLFSLPNDFYYDGYKGLSLDMFSLAGPFIRVIKDVLNVSICIFTAIACYHKLRGFFIESEG